MPSFPHLLQGIDRQIVFYFCDRRERHFRKFSLLAGKPPKACRWWCDWRAGEHPARVLSRTASATPASALPQSRAANRFSFKISCRYVANFAAQKWGKWHPKMLQYHGSTKFPPWFLNVFNIKIQKFDFFSFVLFTNS